MLHNNFVLNRHHLPNLQLKFHQTFLCSPKLAIHIKSTKLQLPLKQKLHDLPKSHRMKQFQLLIFTYTPWSFCVFYLPFKKPSNNVHIIDQPKARSKRKHAIQVARRKHLDLIINFRCFHSTSFFLSFSFLHLSLDFQFGN